MGKRLLEEFVCIPFEPAQEFLRSEGDCQTHEPRTATILLSLVPSSNPISSPSLPLHRCVFLWDFFFCGGWLFLNVVDE